MKNVFTLILALFSFSQAFTQTYGLEWAFSNPQVVGPMNARKFQFDVLMKATTNGSFHQAGDVYINYNPAAFGTQVVTNAKVTVLKLNLLNEEAFPGFPKYLLRQNDNYDPVDDLYSIALNWEAQINNAPFMTAVPDVLTPFVRVSIEILDSTKLAGVKLYPKLMEAVNGQVFYLTNTQYTVPYTYSNNLFIYSLNGSTLPVEFLSFEGRSESGNVLLDWVTFREINADRFEVEKSFDGSDYFTIGSVTSVGNSNFPTAYNFRDDGQMAEVIHYRLRQIDLDGVFSYSPVVEVLTTQIEPDLMVQLNPDQEILSIRVLNGEMNLEKVMITSTLGQVVYKENVKETGKQKWEVPVSGLAPGVYFVKAEFKGSKNLIQKILLQQ